MASDALRIRAAGPDDLGAIIDIDAEVTGLRKVDYWYELFARYGGTRGRPQRSFLVAERDRHILGFIIGEVRDWEFGSPPCGWVFAIDVDPQVRQRGVASALLAAMRERFESVGVRVLRTMLASDNHLILSFFRSQGMRAGRLIPLETEIGGDA